MKRILSIFLVIALAGCQSIGGYSAEQLTASYKGKPVQYFMDRNPNFTPVSAKSIGEARRQFTLETDPVLVTTTLPSYTPASRNYNNASLGGAFNNLNAAVNTVPAVSRSSVMQCRIIIEATQTSNGGMPKDWAIDFVEKFGSC